MCISLQVRWRPSPQALWRSGGTSGPSWSSVWSQPCRLVCCCSCSPRTTSGSATRPTSSSGASTSSWCLSPRGCQIRSFIYHLTMELQRLLSMILEISQLNYFFVLGSVLIIFAPLHSFQIASSLTKELCALVFGINTFLGTILKSIINLIFADKRGLALDVKSQVETVSSYLF